MTRVLSDADRRVGPIEASTVADLVERGAAMWDHDAVAFPHERDTYPEFAARADHFARGLLALGLERGDKVGLLLPQGLDYLAAVFGAAKVGGASIRSTSRPSGRFWSVGSASTKPTGRTRCSV